AMRAHGDRDARRAADRAGRPVHDGARRPPGPLRVPDAVRRAAEPAARPRAARLQGPRCDAVRARLVPVPDAAARRAPGEPALLRARRVQALTAGARLNGSSNVNVEPTPTVDSTSIVPPWVVTISRATASPSPVPPTVVVFAAPRKNLSNTRSRSSGGMPRPESVTENTARWSRTPTYTRTTPPSGEYLIAFESRLPTTCASRSRSP